MSSCVISLLHTVLTKLRDLWCCLSELTTWQVDTSSAQQEISSLILQMQRSILLCWQKFSIGSCSKSAESNPRQFTSALFTLKILGVIFLLEVLWLKWLKHCLYLSFSLCMLCPMPISSSVIYLCQQYWMESTNHEFLP